MVNRIELRQKLNFQSWKCQFSSESCLFFRAQSGNNLCKIIIIFIFSFQAKQARRDLRRGDPLIPNISTSNWNEKLLPIKNCLFRSNPRFFKFFAKIYYQALFYFYLWVKLCTWKVDCFFWLKKILSLQDRKSPRGSLQISGSNFTFEKFGRIKWTDWSYFVKNTQSIRDHNLFSTFVRF